MLSVYKVSGNPPQAQYVVASIYNFSLVRVNLKSFVTLPATPPEIKFAKIFAAVLDLSMAL